jgi:hypothetical protein
MEYIHETTLYVELCVEYILNPTTTFLNFEYQPNMFKKIPIFYFPLPHLYG